MWASKGFHLSASDGAGFLRAQSQSTFGKPSRLLLQARLLYSGSQIHQPLKDTIMQEAKSLYLVLDMQNDLVHDGGPNGKGPLGQQVRKRQLLPKTAAAIAEAREAGILVGFVRVGFSAGYPECPPNSPMFSAAPEHGLFQLGSWGTEIHPDLEEREGDIQVIKHRVSPFYSTTLEAQLRARNIRRIYCSGVSTQAVVQAAVRDGHDRDFEMILLEDLCAAFTLEEHHNSIGSLGRFCRIEKSDTVVFSNP